MATVFSTAYKNSLIDTLTGRASTIALYYIMPYNGVQPADPTTAPAGVSPVTSYSVGWGINGQMSAPSMGVSSLAAPRNCNATSTVSGMTFGRIFNSSGTGCIDTSISLSGGGGGIIVPTLSASSGSPYTMSAFSYKWPQTNGTVMLNADLVNSLVNNNTVVAGNTALCTSSVVNIYSGSAPSSADAAVTGTLLVSFACGATSPWASASGGAAALTANLTAAATATNTAGYARIVKGAMVLQGSVGLSAADFILDTLTIVSGNTITLTEATISI